MAAKSPKRPNPYPDRHFDCQEALEVEIKALIAGAQAARWSSDDVGPAIGDLWWAQEKAMEEVARMETELALMRASARAAR